MKKVFTVSILGCGSRGVFTYGRCIKENIPDCFKIVSLCDNNEEKLKLAQADFGVSEKDCFLDANEFLKEKRSALAIENDCAVVFENGEIVRTVSTGGKAFAIECKDGALVKTEL
jgi:predicted dehydrogenase